jgi:hypothetical protein
MAVIISLRDFIDEVQALADDQQAYLDKTTGEFTTITNDDVTVIESGNGWSDYPEWKQSIFQNTAKVLSSNDYLELPKRLEVQEYEFMERFCLSVANEEISYALFKKIHNSGVFSEFEGAISRYRIEDDWLRFIDEAYKEIAIAWLESHGFEYIDDINR